MASELKLQVPDGQFCSDTTHLGCLYKQTIEGRHYCPIFYRNLDKVEVKTTDGERVRLTYKCPECLQAAQLTTETSDEIKVDRVLHHGWVFS